MAMAAVSYTGHEQGLTDVLATYTGIAWGLGSTAVAAWLAYMLDTYLFSHIPTWSEIEDGNTAMAIWAASVFVVIVLSMTLVQMSVGQPTAVVDSARADLGKVEQPPGSNEGPLPKQCLNHVNLPEGYPYCAACVSLWADQACMDYPTKDGEPLRSAATRDFRSADCAVKVGPIMRGEVRPDSGSVVVWQKGNGQYGHAGILVDMKGTRCFRSIEANTSSGDEGSQRDGEGVYARTRCMNPQSYFSVTRVILPDCEERSNG